MDDSRDLSELKSDVAISRHRVRNDLEQVRSAADPRDLVRRHPYLSLGLAAASGVVMASAILPPGRSRALPGLISGGLHMAYRGFFIAATPVFARGIADYCRAVKHEMFPPKEEPPSPRGPS